MVLIDRSKARVNTVRIIFIGSGAILCAAIFGLLSIPVFFSLPSNDYGYIDRSGKTVLPMSRQVALSPFVEGTALVYEVPGDVRLVVTIVEGMTHKNWHTGTCWFINKSGGAAIPRSFDGAHDFSEGLAAVRLRDQWGFIDHAGKFVVNPQFWQVQNFVNGLAPVCTSQYWGFIDKSGRKIIDEKFEEVLPFHEGLAAAKLHGKVGFIDVHGNWAISPQYECGCSFSQGLAFIQNSDHTGYIDKNGKLVISTQKIPPAKPSELDGPLLLRFSQSSCFLIGPLHKPWQTQPVDLFKFSQQRAVAVKNGHYGYIDTSGVFVISPEFDYAYPFTDGRALVFQHGQFRYLDQAGHTVIAHRFDHANNFSEKLRP